MEIEIGFYEENHLPEFLEANGFLISGNGTETIFLNPEFPGLRVSYNPKGVSSLALSQTGSAFSSGLVMACESESARCKARELVLDLVKRYRVLTFLPEWIDDYMPQEADLFA